MNPLRTLLLGLLFIAGIAAASGQSTPTALAQELIAAAGEGDAERIRLTLARGADVNGTDTAGGNALIRAAGRGHVDAVKALLKAKPKLDHVNSAGRTALLEAIVTGDGSPRFGHVVLLLSAAGADVNIADPNRTTPLDHARRKGYDSMAGVLEHAGAK